MKAIILASGMGKRLLPLTKNTPKPLIKLNHKTLIEHQIKHLTTNNINKIIITTGPFEQKLTSFINQRFPNLNITYINNPRFQETNYIYSLWLTKNHINDDIILLHGDLLFDINLLKRLVDTTGNHAVVNKTITAPEKDFKATIENNKITKIGVHLQTKNSYLLMPLYKFIKHDFQTWMTQIESEINNNNVNIYAEDAFNKISHQILLEPVYFTTQLCMEIDTIEDLQKARELIKKD